MSINITKFGKTNQGQEVQTITLKNGDVCAEIITFGATIKSFIIDNIDIALGFDTLAEYEINPPYIGATIGRYGNRIADGKFSLNGKDYQLPINNGPNSLHGGLIGFSHKVWDVVETTENSVMLSLFSPDGEEGYPGNLTVKVAFTLTETGCLKIDYTATTDQDTIINLTNHSYFNLDGSETILDHQLKLASDTFVPVDKESIPTGEIRSVSGTPFDFTTAKKIGQDINDDCEQLVNARGYDHTFTVAGDINVPFAEARSEKNGLKLTAFTTEPGVQLYTANWLGGLAGKNGTSYADQSGFCLETQHYPDSPNQPDFPSTVLKAGEVFQSTTIYQLTRG